MGCRGRALSSGAFQQRASPQLWSQLERRDLKICSGFTSDCRAGHCQEHCHVEVQHHCFDVLPCFQQVLLSNLESKEQSWVFHSWSNNLKEETTIWALNPFPFLQVNFPTLSLQLVLKWRVYFKLMVRLPAMISPTTWFKRLVPLVVSTLLVSSQESTATTRSFPSELLLLVSKLSRLIAWSLKLSSMLMVILSPSSLTSRPVWLQLWTNSSKNNTIQGLISLTLSM